MIDQLKKQKFLEALAQRAPAQDVAVPVAPVTTTIDAPQIDVNADYGGDELLADANSALESRGQMPRVDKTRQERQTENAQNDFMVGASQALISLLTGNHNKAVMGFDKGNKYVQDRRNEDRTDLKTLVKTNQNGKPIYTPSIEAADMEAYNAPSKAAGSNGAANSFQLTQAYDPATDTYSTIRFNTRTGEAADASGNIVTLPKGIVVKPVAPKIYKTEDVQGTVSNKEKNPYASKPKAFDTTAGLGKYYDVGTQGQGKNIEESQGRGQKESEDITGSIVDASSAENTIKNSNDPRAISAAIYSLVRSVEPKGVLTEQDFQVISGNSFLPTLDEIQQYISKKGTGNLEQVKKSFLGLSTDIRRRLQQRLDSVPGRFGGSKNKVTQLGVDKTIPSSQKSSAKNKAEYIQLESAAKKRWGPTSGVPRPDILNKFLEEKRRELGIE